MADVDDKAAPKAHDGEEPRNEDSKAAVPDRPESGDHSKEAGTASSSKLLEEISKIDWKNLGDAFGKATGMEAKSMLSWNPLGEQRDWQHGHHHHRHEHGDRHDRHGNDGNSALSLLDRNDFKFDFRGGVSDLGKYTGESSFVFRGMNTTFKDPFESGRPVTDQKDMGFSLSGLAASTAEFMGLGVYTPQQISNMFSWDKGSFNFDGKQTPAAQNSSWGGFDYGGFGKFCRGLKDDFVSIGSGLSLGATSILNNLDFNNEGKVSLGSSLKTSFFDATNVEVQKNKIESGTASSGWWESAKDWGSKAWDGIKTLGNAVIDFDFGGAKHETLQGKNGNIERVSDQNGNSLIGTDRNNIAMKRQADGTNDTTVSSKDGSVSIHHNPDGSETASNKNSDVSFTRNEKTGKVDAIDKSGKTIATFDDKGDAVRFFANSVTQVVPPGTNLESAYNDYKAKLEEQLKADPNNPELLKMKDKPVMFMDGKGESMTVQPGGGRLYTHGNGNAEMIVPHVDADKKSHQIEVHVTTDANGNEHFTVGEKGGKQFELTSEEAKRLMANSRLKLDPNGNLQVNDDTSGKPENGRWNPIMDPHNRHRIRAWDKAYIDLKDGTTIINDGKVQAEFKPNPTTGGVTETDYQVKADGSVDKNPVRVISTDGKGKTTIQGMDPETGKCKPGDVVTIDSNNNNAVDAWNRILMNDDRTTLKNEDGSEINIDDKGNVEELDKDGNPVWSSDGEEVHYHGNQSYEEWRESYDEQQAENAVDAAVSIGAIVDVAAASLLSSLNIDAGQIDMLEKLLSGAIGALPAGVALPPQISAARASLAAARNRLGSDNSVENTTTSIAGVKSDELIKYAREAGTSDPYKAARYALRRAGYDIPE